VETPSLKSEKNVIQAPDSSEVLLAVTLIVNSRESTQNADLPQELAINFQDAEELLLPDSVDLPLSRDQTPDASFPALPRANVMEAEFVNKQKVNVERQAIHLSILLFFLFQYIL